MNPTASPPPVEPAGDQRRLGRRFLAWLETVDSRNLAGVVLWITAAVHLLDLSRLSPEAAMPAYLDEGGPFQNFQLMVLGWALVLSLLGIWMHAGDTRGVFVLLVGPCFYLFWREADWDKDYLSAWLGAEGVRMFSWRYLAAGSEFPLRLQLVLGSVSLGLSAFWLVQCWRFRTSLGSLLRTARRNSAILWLALAFAWLVAAQFPDRGWLSVGWRKGAVDGYLEEAPELLGELAWLLFVFIVWDELRQKARQIARQ